ncbi:hypothetical protein [Amycolatopsis sp. NPDC021455]|uniref:hypothetical protein n=1 Tax=Amycolatopsis sp. NPDC021455 TaxID=3154901 RepID=UPI0034110800
MRIDCHIPVTVRIVGVPTDDQLAALGRTLSRVVAARLAEAQRVLDQRYGRAPERPGPDDADRVTFQLTDLPVRPAPPARQPTFEERLLAEAVVLFDLLRPAAQYDRLQLAKVIDVYGSTADYAAFLDGLAAEHLDKFFRSFQFRFGVLVRSRPGVSRDLARLVGGPEPDDPDYWRLQESRNLAFPITVGDRTHLTLDEHWERVPGPGDQHDLPSVFVRDGRWEMTEAALHAYLVRMAGPLTQFEEHLVANWNRLHTAPQFDGGRIIGYTTRTGGSGDYLYQVWDPTGKEVFRWHDEPPLVNEGLGPIDYVLLAHGAFQLGTALARVAARLAAKGLTTAVARNIVLSLRLATSRLSRVTASAMEGVEGGLAVPGLTSGGSVPSLVLRDVTEAGTGAVRDVAARDAAASATPDAAAREAAVTPDPVPPGPVAPATVRVPVPPAAVAGAVDAATTAHDATAQPPVSPPAVAGTGVAAAQPRPPATAAATAAVSREQIVAEYERVANRKIPDHVRNLLARQRSTPTRVRLAVLRRRFERLRDRVGTRTLTARERSIATRILREARDLARDDFDTVRDSLWRRLRRDPDLLAIEQRMRALGFAEAGGLALRISTPTASGTVFEGLGVEHRIRLSDNPWRYNDPDNLIVTDAPQNERYLEAIRRHGFVWPTDPIEDFVIRNDLNDQHRSFQPGPREPDED